MKIKLSVFTVLLILGLMSCTQNYYIKSTPSDSVLIKTQKKVNTKVNYSVDYLATDPLLIEYAWYQNLYHVKDAYITRLDQFLHTKYTISDVNTVDYIIKFKVQHAQIDRVQKRPFGGLLTVVGNPGDAAVGAIITVLIEITGKKNTQNVITATSVMSVPIDSDFPTIHEALLKCIDDCISKSLILSSEFLDQSI